MDKELIKNAANYFMSDNNERIEALSVLLMATTPGPEAVTALRDLLVDFAMFAEWMKS